MKVTLEFNLPEEVDGLKLALDGQKWYGVAWEIHQWLRKARKYGHTDQTVDEMLEGTWDMLREIMDVFGVSFEDVS